MNDMQSIPTEYKQAFRDADIRGVYPDQLNDEVVYRIARSFVSLYELSEVVLGRDMRTSSPALRDAFVRGITDQGADVIDIGEVDTPAVYFVSGTRNMYGAMITASHNPPEYNGVKLVKSGAIPLTKETGLSDIQTQIEKNIYTDVSSRGTVREENISDTYREYIRSYVSVPDESDVSVVVDGGNGMGGWVVRLMCDELPVSIHPILFEPDGTFPVRGSNPTKNENMGPVKDAISEHAPDFGVAFDGDVDRVAFFDENGNAINSAVIGALIARHFLRTGEGDTFVYTHFTSRSYYEAITTNGGKTHLARVGHAFIKNLMREHDAVFACEHSAHFYFKANYYTDSGILAFLKVLELYTIGKQEGKQFSDLVAELDKYVQSEEELIEVEDKAGVLEQIRDEYATESCYMDETDGVYIECDDYWFDLKESVTEDALKLIVEAVDEDTMRSRKQEILTRVKDINAKNLG